MKFAVIPNMTRVSTKPVTEAFLKKASLLGSECFLDMQLSGEFPPLPGVTFLPEEAAISECDVVAAVGGDGTFINAAKRATASNKPLLCINAGKLAFLAGIEPDEMELLSEIVKGNYRVEHRMLLEAKVTDEAGNTRYHANCVNDAVVSRTGRIRIMNLSIACDGEKLIDYMADGVIVATPTGSTAYSLSAGGPVIEPQVESLLLTPVCCHTVFSRSVVLGSSAVLDIRHDNSGEVILSCDGNEPVPVPDGCFVRVARSMDSVQLIKVKNDTFLDTLSKKMSK